MAKRKTHWAQVTSAIARKTGKSFYEAKLLYGILKKRKPDISANQVARMNRRQIAALKGAGTKAQKRMMDSLKKRVREKEKRAKKAKPIKLFSPLPRSEKPRWESYAFIKPAPKLPKTEKPKAVPVEYGRRARNRFEQYCKEAGAPFLNSGTIAKVIASQWRNDAWLKTMAKIVADAWKSINRNGYVNDKVRQRLRNALEKIKDAIYAVEADPSDFWYGILKQLYA